MHRVANKVANSLALVGPLSAALVAIPAAGTAVAVPTMPAPETTAGTIVPDTQHAFGGGSLFDAIPAFHGLGSVSKDVQHATAPKSETKVASKAVSLVPTAPVKKATLGSAMERSDSSSKALTGRSGASSNAAPAQSAGQVIDGAVDVYWVSKSGNGTQQALCDRPQLEYDALIQEPQYDLAIGGGASGLLLQSSRPVVGEYGELIGWEGRSLIGPVTAYAICADDNVIS